MDHWGITLMCLLQNNKELLIIWHCLLEWSHRMVHSPKPKGNMFPLQCSTQEMLWFLKGKSKEDIDGIDADPLQLGCGIQVRSIQIKFSVLSSRKSSQPFRGLGTPLYLAPTSKVLFLVCAKSLGFLIPRPSP